MGIIPQFVALGGIASGSRMSPTVTYDVAVVNVAPNIALFGSGSGSGYRPADVGTPFTVDGGNPTVRPGGIITQVTNGGISGLQLNTVGRYPTTRDLPNNATITGGSGTGAQVILDADITPVFISRTSCGFPANFDQITISTWTMWNVNASCDLNYYKAGYFGGQWNSMGLFPNFFQIVWTPGAINSYMTVSMNLPQTQPMADQATIACHLLMSYDTKSATFHCYLNNQFCSHNMQTWMPAPMYGNSPFDGSPCQWRLHSSDSQPLTASCVGIASFWCDDRFIDLSQNANRAQFIDGDGLPVSFDAYPSSKIHLYTLPGEAPSAFANNRGTGGPWEAIGPLTWQGSTMAVSDANWQQHEYSTQEGSTVSGTLAGEALSYTDWRVMDNTLRPGATLNYTGITSPPANGVATLTSDGSFYYTPNAGFVGTDSFLYSVTEAMDPPYQSPGLTEIGEVEITVSQLDGHKLVALYPYDLTGQPEFPWWDANSFYAIEDYDNWDLPAFLSQFSISIWCCQNVTLTWGDSPQPQGSLVMSPAQCQINLADIDGSPVFSASFINPGTPASEYQILFSIDTDAQDYTFFANNIEWPSADATFYSSNPIANATRQ